MNKRRISGRQLAWLLKELDSWRAARLLSPEQAEAVRDLYESTEQVTHRKRSVALVALMSVAAFLIGLAVLLLISYNWQQMSRPLKLALIFGAIGGTHFAAWHLRFRRQSRVLSEVLFLLGCLFYGAGIFLVAQIFHINAHYPNGIWWWALGTLLVAVLLDTAVVHVLAAGLLATWCGFEIIGFGELGLWLFGRWGHLPNGAYSLPILALVGLLWAYRHDSAKTVALYAPVLAWWVVLQPFAWHWKAESVYFIGAVGGLLLFVAEAHGVRTRFSIPYRLWGTLVSAGILVPLSFHEFNEEIVDEMSDQLAFLPTIVILGIAAAVFILAASARRDDGDLFQRMLAGLRRQILPAGLILLMSLLPLWNRTAGETVLPTIACNLAMIGLAFWLIQVGLRDDRGFPFTAGVIYFLLWSVLRYIDLFGDFGGMLGASLMFFLCGAVLFGVAIFWRRRKEIHLG